MEENKKAAVETADTEQEIVDLDKVVEKAKELVRALQEVVDWIVNDSCEDICQVCAYYKDFPYVDDDIEPCPYRRTNGATACRNGIIEHFQTEV